MKKRFIVPAILLCISAIVQAQIPDVIPVETDPYTDTIVEPGLLPPAPMVQAEPFISRVGWLHFTMFSDGSFSRREVVVKTFGSTGEKAFRKDRKGKYTSQPNPPHSARTITISTTHPPPLPSVPDPFALRAAQTDSIHPEWNAAALLDTHYFAIVLKNTDPEISQTGTLSLRFPTDAFDFDGTVFPPNPAVFGSLATYTDDGDEAHRPGTIVTWQVNNLSPRDSQTIFVKLKVKDQVADSIQRIQISSNLRFSNAQQTTPGAQPFLIVKSTSETRVTNPYQFRETNATVVAINAARDPNSLSVQPQRLPPAGNAPAHTLRYTVNVENEGSAMAKFLFVDIVFDPKIKSGVPVFATALHFPNANTTSADDGIRFSSITKGWNGNTLSLLFNNANLAMAIDQDSNYYAKASFDIEVETAEGIELQEGETISSKALIRMKSTFTSKDDSVWTDPAVVRIEKPGKIPFGCVLGIKGHTNVFSPDSAVRTRGVDLTFRFPIINRRISNLSGSNVLPPRLFWQIEAGWGTGSFQHPTDGGAFETRYVHFTPALIRYFQPFHAGAYFMYTGLSAGYSAGYIYSGKSGGLTATLPPGFGKRLEHEVALSIDLSNRIDVPAWTLGLGYKFKWNNLLSQNVSYNFPFVYLQLDIVRFNHRFVKLWEKVKYCH